MTAEGMMRGSSSLKRPQALISTSPELSIKPPSKVPAEGNNAVYHQPHCHTLNCKSNIKSS